MEDYAGNSNKAKKQKPPAEKNIERVTKGEVIIQKPGVGKKLKNLFVAADFKSVSSYVIYDVFIPALKNMIADGASRGVDRMMFGERGMRARGVMPGPRVTYNSPVSRPYAAMRPAVDNLDRTGLRQPTGSRIANNGYILAIREDAQAVVERMGDILDEYDVVTVGDLNRLTGYAGSHIDEAWGWKDISEVQVRTVREGFLIDIPPAEPIQ